jgi:hypothetical protein
VLIDRRKNYNYTTKVPQSGTIGGEIMKTIVKGAIRDQKGQVLILTMILLVVGGLILTPLLGLMSTGLISGRIYENSMYILYAADAGIEDGLWRIKYAELADLFANYDEYDYSKEWGYNLTSDQGGVAEVAPVNDKNVYVTIENVWIPMGIDPPAAATARQIIEEGKLIIAGNPSGTSEYQIKISYDTSCAGPGNERVQTLGIWLPAGFEYVKGSSDLEKDSRKPYYSVPTVSAYKGGYAVVWRFVSSVLVKDFPDTVTCQYLGPQGQTPGAAVSWIITTGDYYTWDADVRVYRITSTATDPDTGKQTTVESYTNRIEPRKLGSAVSGDYYATGATLMTATGSDKKFRNKLFKESSATVEVGDIPSNARIDAAWLYWSGWIEEGPAPTILFQDNCSDFNAPPVAWTAGSAWGINNGRFRGNAYYQQPPGERVVIWGPENCSDFGAPVMNWTAGNAWDISNWRFRGTAYNKGSSPGRYLTMSFSIDLSTYAGQTVEISWQQYEGGELEDSDRLYFAFSGDDGSTWGNNIEAFHNDNPSGPFSCNIPNLYLTDDFKMRFYLYGFSERDCSFFNCAIEYCYIDNIEISVLAVPPYEPPGRYLTMTGSLDLSGATAGSTELRWTQSEDGADVDDCLKFQLSADDGASWGDPISAFCGDLNWDGETFVYDIPEQYLTNSFKMRFYLDNFSGNGEYCHIDDILISTLTGSPVEEAKVNRVMFNGSQITADQSQVEPTPDSGAPGSWSYSCYYIATDTVIAELGSDMSGTFTLGHVLEGTGTQLYNYPSGTKDGMTGYPLATPAKDQSSMQYQWTYAGWSLLIIYSSPETKGHQLYLFDTFHYVGAGGDPAEVPFSISGFLAPDDTTGSHLTYFVGEGDDHYTGDSIEMNGNPLSDPPDNPWDNIFNSYSNAIDDPIAKSGIDIDTFDMSEYINPNDSSAEVTLITREGSQDVAEIYNLVYIILSFRSNVTSGGVMGYLIRG